MPAWLALFCITLANGITGGLILWQWAILPRFRLGYGMRSLGWGLALNGWLAVLLAEFGRFTPRNLALIWLLPIFVLVWRRRAAIYQWRPVRLLPPRLTIHQLAFLAYLPVALWLFCRPHQFVKGAADAGVYVNLAANINRTGRVLIHDPDLAALDRRLDAYLLRPLPPGDVAPYLLLPGFYVTDPAQGAVVPQFYPLYPVWQAIALRLGGLEAALMTTGLWAVWGSLALYLTARAVGGRVAGWLALAGLTLTGLQIWFARYPTTETLTQSLVWLGLWALTRWLGADDRSRRLPDICLAGLLLGQTLLARIDMFFVLALPLGLGIWIGLKARPLRRAGLGFALTLGLMAVHSFGHAWWQSRPYFLSTYGYLLRVMVEKWGVWSTGLVALGALIWLFGRYRVRLSTLLPWERLLRGLGAAAVLGLAAYAWFIRPQTAAITYPDWYSGQAVPLLDQENLRRLAWYLSPLGVWLGCLGIAWVVWRGRARHLFSLGLGLFFTLLYVWRIQANPLQVYVMRRYVPVVMPYLTLCAAVWLASGMIRPNFWQRAAAATTAALWLAALAWLARGLVTQVDYVGLPAQLDALNAQFAPHSVLLFNDPAAVGQGDILGTPLRFLYQQTVFDLRQTEALDTAALAAQVRAWAATRSVYWLAVPGGVAWPLPAVQLERAGAYTIVTQALEESYTQRPRAIVTQTWAGEIYRVQP